MDIATPPVLRPTLSSVKPTLTKVPSVVATVPAATAGAVVSGLPLLSMSPRKVMAILMTTFACLRADGAFYQFTYGPRCPVRQPVLDRLGLAAHRIGGALFNLPPASVYRITRRGPGAESAQRPEM